MFTGIKKWFNELPPGYQFLVIAIVVFVLARAIKKAQAMNKAVTAGLGSKTELQLLASNQIKPSYAKYTYDSWADKLYKAMKGIGTDNDMVFAVFNSLKNDADYIKLDQAFGMRDTYTMKEWVHGDLSTTKINTINSGFKTKGMTKRI